MKFIYDIPPVFWGLFRSVNRDIYMEALLTINDEYQYNNYFLSKEACVQILSDMCSARRYAFMREEIETDEDEQEALPGRILNWLIKTKWLRKIEDYTTMTTNIVIPDYAAVMIEAFEKLVSQPLDDTDIYIQNVYATLFSFKNDRRMNLTMLKTALVNTRKLNKALQDMLHNMDKFFERLLQKKSYEELLKEHLEGYVEEVVKRKYHILKTSDNFYIYKMDIKRCLKEMREDEAWVEQIRKKQQLESQRNQSEQVTSVLDQERSEADLPYSYTRFLHRNQQEDVLELIDQIERGFDDIENRISNMDKEHSKYIRATVSRLNYLLSDETERHGMLIQLLNQLGVQEDPAKQEEKIKMVSDRMNLSTFEVLSDNPLYKRRRKRRFEENLAEEEESRELSKEDVLRLNKISHRFTRKQIEEFIAEHMVGDTLEADSIALSNDEDFEKLILAYDISMRKNSAYEVIVKEERVENGNYCYPSMTFVKRQKIEERENKNHV